MNRIQENLTPIAIFLAEYRTETNFSVKGC